MFRLSQVWPVGAPSSQILCSLQMSAYSLSTPFWVFWAQDVQIHFLLSLPQHGSLPILQRTLVPYRKHDVQYTLCNWGGAAPKPFKWTELRCVCVRVCLLLKYFILTLRYLCINVHIYTHINVHIYTHIYLYIFAHTYHLFTSILISVSISILKTTKASHDNLTPWSHSSFLLFHICNCLMLRDFSSINVLIY